MNYAVILAGGTGSRMKSIKVPKQYHEINGIPILIYTLKTFVEINCFDYIYIAIDDYYKNFQQNRCLAFYKLPNHALIEKVQYLQHEN